MFYLYTPWNQNDKDTREACIERVDVEEMAGDK